MHAILTSLMCQVQWLSSILRKRLCYDTADEGSLVDQAVGEGTEELIGGVVLNQHPFAHCQSLSRGGCHNITFAGIDEHLHSTITGCRPLAATSNRMRVRW